jgi:hypothetical protein
MPSLRVSSLGLAGAAMRRRTVPLPAPREKTNQAKPTSKQRQRPQAEVSRTVKPDRLVCCLVPRDTVLFSAVFYNWPADRRRAKAQRSLLGGLGGLRPRYYIVIGVLGAKKDAMVGTRENRPSTLTAILRGALGRCPRCGYGRLLHSSENSGLVFRMRRTLRPLSYG